MNKNIGLQLVVYSLVLAGLGYLAHHLAPTLARTTLIVGLAGGALCLVWGFRAALGHGGKALPILTLVAVNFMLLSQTVMAWAGGGAETPERRPAAAVMTLLFVLSIGMLMRIAYAGVALGEPPANPAKNADANGKTAREANPFNRAR